MPTLGHHVVDWQRGSEEGGKNQRGRYGRQATVGQTATGTQVGRDLALAAGFWSLVLALPKPGAPALSTAWNANSSGLGLSGLHPAEGRVHQLALEVPTLAKSSSRRLTEIEDTVFFAADDGVHGSELWKTDGTPDGTVLVKDISPGAGGGLGNNWQQLGMIELDGLLLFWASDGVHGKELWKLQRSPGLQLVAPRQTLEGRVVVTFDVVPQRIHIVQPSEDLQNWVAVDTFSGGVASVAFIDAGDFTDHAYFRVAETEYLACSA